MSGVSRRIPRCVRCQQRRACDVCVCVLSCGSGKLLYEAHVIAMWQCLTRFPPSESMAWLLPVYHVCGTHVDVAVLYFHKHTPWDKCRNPSERIFRIREWKAAADVQYTTGLMIQQSMFTPATLRHCELACVLLCAWPSGDCCDGVMCAGCVCMAVHSFDVRTPADLSRLKTSLAVQQGLVQSVLRNNSWIFGLSECCDFGTLSCRFDLLYSPGSLFQANELRRVHQLNGVPAQAPPPWITDALAELPVLLPSLRLLSDVG